MNKAKYQKMYTEKYKQDMDFVIIGDYYIGPFIDMDVAQKAVSAINKQYATQPKRTRTEYEKVTESIFDLRDEFERGELWCKHEFANDYSKVINTQTLAQSLHGGYCFRKVEKQLDWCDECMNYFKCCPHLCEDDKIINIISGNDSAFAEGQFLELCRTALRARGEL